MLDDLPVLAVCGWSGSGKTTLIERLVPLLRARGLDIAVVKHDVHGIDVDRPGKDSDRLFRAGADVLLRGKEEAVLRTHRRTHRPGDLADALKSAARRYDLVLVEGHKDTPLRKLWLYGPGPGEESLPADVSAVMAALPRESDRVAAAMSILDDWLAIQWLRTPVYGCVLAAARPFPAFIEACISNVTALRPIRQRQMRHSPSYSRFGSFLRIPHSSSFGLWVTLLLQSSIART